MMQLYFPQEMLQDKLRATDWEATYEAMEEAVARESYLEWLKENERRSRKVVCDSNFELIFILDQTNFILDSSISSKLFILEDQ